ncbi:unnamed protein product [Amoebophrya sp. A25]|nr:unnamed protein product [Amoebophrya sp. A25]|eukprot:GSA25T00006497001.1
MRRVRKSLMTQIWAQLLLLAPLNVEEYFMTLVYLETRESKAKEQFRIEHGEKVLQIFEDYLVNEMQGRRIVDQLMQEVEQEHHEALALLQSGRVDKQGRGKSSSGVVQGRDYATRVVLGVDVVGTFTSKKWWDEPHPVVTDALQPFAKFLAYNYRLGKQSHGTEEYSYKNHPRLVAVWQREIVREIVDEILPGRGGMRSDVEERAASICWDSLGNHMTNQKWAKQLGVATSAASSKRKDEQADSGPSQKKDQGYLEALASRYADELVAEEEAQAAQQQKGVRASKRKGGTAVADIQQHADVAIGAGADVVQAELL